MSENNSILLENEQFRLLLSPAGTASSLILKSSGEECLCDGDTPLCTLTEDRLYNNELKLAHPTKETTLSSNRLRLEGDNLIVGFEQIEFEAVVRVEIAERYMLFSLADFRVRPDSFGLGVVPMLPPVREFRMLQLHLKDRERFGEWLNVLWDDRAAVNVLAACPLVKAGSAEQNGHKILFGESLRDVQLKNAPVALVVSKPEEHLDSLHALETECGLPLGVESRRSAHINRSYYWTSSITPDTADEHIAYAKKGGFTHMLMYYTAMTVDIGGYKSLGDYDYRPEYKNGRADLAAMLQKIKDAGITPGLHVLHSQVGLLSRYMTPVADHRLNLKRHFTLARDCTPDDTTIYVEENPQDMPIYEKMRILQFMGELIHFESCSTERPYCFTGCERGFNGTTAKAHQCGTIGGLLDISEFVSNSAYINQATSLQDEVAQKIADVYNAGFEFLYFDGSEGVNAPFDINVALAQWRVYEKCERKPVFCEGAAKSNFSWHMLSGGNAFDVWKPDVFKERIAEHPFREAKRMAHDFTRVNFGWWRLTEGQRPDILEYGTALAAACDCPGAFMGDLRSFKTIPRADDILETLRRWELARSCGFITPAVKAELAKTETEHTLLIDEAGRLELAAWEQIPDTAGGNEAVTVFLLERKGHTCAVCWNNAGDGTLCLPLGGKGVRYYDEIGGEKIPVGESGAEIRIPLGKKRYLITDLPREELKKAFAEAKLL
ncbi:MAG: hypothetical protein IJD06_01300 [Clostridia bacterium]|nr:hypothetical protein [Clostridia bacterium]